MSTDSDDRESHDKHTAYMISLRTGEVRQIHGRVERLQYGVMRSDQRDRLEQLRTEIAALRRGETV